MEWTQWMTGYSSIIPMLCCTAIPQQHYTSRIDRLSLATGTSPSHSLSLCSWNCKASKPRSHFRTAAARISFLGWERFEEFEVFSSYGARNSLASSHCWLLFVEPASYFDGQFLSIMWFFTFFNFWICRGFIIIIIILYHIQKRIWGVLVF